MNKNFKTILAVGLTAVLVACGSNKKVVEQQPAEGSEAEPQVARESIAPQRRANRNVAFDQYFNEIKPDAAPAKPDDKGFIRRWTIIEPINKPNSGNTVFTDSYLREHFNREYFKGQQTILPKDGQKVKAEFKQEQAPAGFGRGMQQAPAQPEVKTVKQTLTWHALDSENFNVKLFRFAEKYGTKVYGVLFWGVTIIDCPEDIENVRLAVGSNSASMWWLNGEEVLLMSGDRRMVKDDCMSRRLTLKKGRNVLRGAVINGPGMSDFCVRFLDEKGNPVTNYTIINSK